MNEQRLDTFSTYAGTSPEVRNRVLRNTYWLLAVSLVPTVLGAWIGVSTGIMAALGTGISVVVFLAGVNISITLILDICPLWSRFSITLSK